MDGIGLTRHIDLTQVAVSLFILAFVAVVIYLRRLDKQEGYPLIVSPIEPRRLLGFPLPPPPKVFRLMEGGTTAAPHNFPQIDSHAKLVQRFDGSPLEPIGNPLLAGIGPGAWVMRSDKPMLTEAGTPTLQPLRLLPDWSIAPGESDPRGMAVFDRRWNRIGTVTDLWIDRSIKILRLFEVTLDPALIGGPVAGPVLVPIFHTAIAERVREIRVTALMATEFADIPRPAAPDRITAREDDRLNAYFAAGGFFGGNGPIRSAYGGRS